MPRKRTRQGARNDDADQIVAGLPNELLLEVWDLLPPLERVCISQVCRKWRGIALSVPKVWSSVALVATSHDSWCRCDRQPALSTWTIFQPRSEINNFDFASELLLRSQELPLELTLDVGCGTQRFYRTLHSILRPHCSRIIRLHFSTGQSRRFNAIIGGLPGLPALRTLTAGFDDWDGEYANLPPLITPGAKLPSLRQIHIGASAASDFIAWYSIPMPGVRELSLSPTAIDTILDALTSCSNLRILTLTMATFATTDRSHARRLPRCIDALVHVPEVRLTDLSCVQEPFILANFNDARFRALTLDYRGLELLPDLSRGLSLPSPCDALADPVRLTLKLRGSVYEIAVADADGRRREIIFDRDTIGTAPGLWSFYLSKKTVASATIDTAAWEYFTYGLPEPCAIPNLELVVLYDTAELQFVSLARFSNLHKLRISATKPAARFDGAAVGDLVRSGIGNAPRLPVLSLPHSIPHSEDVSKLADLLEYL